MKSESKVEEIISALWFILGALLWHRAPDWIVYSIWTKAALDTFDSIRFAIKEIRAEKKKQSTPEQP
jgi:hypothetical protein